MKPVTVIPTPKLATADVCDARGDDIFLLPGAFGDFGGRRDFAGPAVTIRTVDDNSLIRDLVGMPGEGRVIVVDGGASMRAALLGGNLAAEAAGNGWAGIIINGCVRDLHEIGTVDIGIKALGTCPRRSENQGRGVRDIEIAIGGVVIQPGYWVIADCDGIVISRELPSL